MYAELAMYEAELARVQQIVEQLGEAQENVDDLKKSTAETIMVDGRPYKEDYINNAIGNLGSAIAYLTGTVIPFLQKKIEELREAIRRYEEEQRRKAAEAARNRENS